MFIDIYWFKNKNLHFKHSLLLQKFSLQVGIRMWHLKNGFIFDEFFFGLVAKVSALRNKNKKTWNENWLHGVFKKCFIFDYQNLWILTNGPQSHRNLDEERHLVFRFSSSDTTRTLGFMLVFLASSRTTKTNNLCLCA